jgi:hypothetical protein
MPDMEKYIEVLSQIVKTAEKFNDYAPIEISLVCVKDILELLKEQEAVVRCKDCEHYDKKTGRCALRHVHGCAETWFCADGERKEGR